MSPIERFTARRKFYTGPELYDMRRAMLRFARSFPPGPERNQHRQIALSLRALLKNSKWLLDHSVNRVAAMP